METGRAGLAGSGRAGPGWLRSTADLAAAAAAGWAARAVLIGGLAWLLMALITDWTSYPLLNVTSWRALTYGPDSVQVSFIVHNSGNAQASHCVAYLKLGGRRLHRAVPGHPAPRHRHVLPQLPGSRAGNRAKLGYARAACDGAIAARQPIPTVRMADLVSGQAQILTPRPARRQSGFQLTEFGSQPGSRAAAPIPAADHRQWR